MHKSNIFFLKGLRKAYSSAFKTFQSIPESESNPNACAEVIFEALSGGKPTMIARLGATEMICISNYLGIKNGKNVWKYIRGIAQPWWWEQTRIMQLQNWSGFFPPTINKVEQFCELMLEDLKDIDVLGSWLYEEKLIKKELQYSKKIKLIFLDPFWAKQPWTRALKNKKVLVVHPFAETIQHQYKRRELLFKDDLLPAFELKTIKAVQSVAGTKTAFADWFAALDHMKSEIDKVEYDVCLIGAGAYGLPLAAHVKRMGKKGFHVGGSLQLLFGIKGKRWENPKQGYSDGVNYLSLFNENWIRPSEDETPKSADKVEGNTYW